ncbi:hypothetical protein HELRODRAFT_105779 [Helobdella robusta]|uniref:Alpha-catulin n=1 Tax=Helobdella robusta TaxID=6412 RepID=T1EDX6_HELRO|nr:hypothetical protein HELRODRAFT_105779 [Helobdella robusta]ESO13189.1 hypothetical protein HELRODRAFT_105779 [Helobdella robusta]
MASAGATSGSGSDGGGSGQDRSSYHHNAKITFDIKTKSVEQTLVPLVHQITTLVNAKEKPLRSERALNALVRVGQAVNMAVDRFVRVGEAIALENPEIQQEMCVACHEAKIADVQMTDEQTTDETARSIAEKTAMVRAARQLLSAISRVLILADRVVIKQLIGTKDKVSVTLKKIECCTNFAEFVQIFSQFGNEMVQLAHASGGRQNDLKSERSRAQVGVARSVLEKSTMLLLTAAKTYLRHHDNQLAKQIRDAVVKQMNSALDLIHHVVSDGDSSSGGSGGSSSGFLIQPVAAFKAIKELEDQAETVRVTLVNSTIEQSLLAACDVVMETIQDFTDSAYTNHEDRELILMLCERLRHEIDQLSSPMATQMKSLDTAILKTKEACRTLKKQLVNTTMDHASNLFRLNEDEVLINDMRMASSGSTQGNMQLVDEVIQQFESHAEQLREVCKLLRHVSSTESLLIWSAHMESTIKSHAPQVPRMKMIMFINRTMIVVRIRMAIVFSETWVNHVNDLSILVKDVSDVCLGKTDKQVYLSLPKPGEQAKIAKAGLEVKLITSELDAEADRWVEPENEIVRRAKNMSCMAFSIYLFTRGEGPLKNTRDLFVQAGYFAEEGTKLYKTAREFSKQVPQSSHKTELMCMLDSVPSYCQHLNFTVRSQTVGKAATFNKVVDQIIQNTKDLMNAIAKLVTSCYVCATKVCVCARVCMCFYVCVCVRACVAVVLLLVLLVRWRINKGGMVFLSVFISPSLSLRLSISLSLSLFLFLALSLSDLEV